MRIWIDTSHTCMANLNLWSKASPPFRHIKPKDLGYPHELWSINLLREHIKNHCSEKGFPELCNVSKSTVWKILNKREIKPHKIKYYLERTDENFEEHMNNVLMLYKEVSLAIELTLGSCAYNLRMAYKRHLSLYRPGCSMLFSASKSLLERRKLPLLLNSHTIRAFCFHIECD